MAWDNYHGRHRITLLPPGRSFEGMSHCSAVNLQKKGSQWRNIIAHVCQAPNGLWRHSSGPSHQPIYGDFKTKRAAVKDAVDSHGTYIGVRRTMDGARRRKRRRR